MWGKLPEDRIFQIERQGRDFKYCVQRIDRHADAIKAICDYLGVELREGPAVVKKVEGANHE